MEWMRERYRGSNRKFIKNKMEIKEVVKKRGRWRVMIRWINIGRSVVGRMICGRKAKKPKLISKPPLLYIAFYV